MKSGLIAAGIVLVVVLVFVGLIGFPWNQNSAKKSLPLLPLASPTSTPRLLLAVPPEEANACEDPGDKDRLVIGKITEVVKDTRTEGVWWIRGEYELFLLEKDGVTLTSPLGDSVLAATSPILAVTLNISREENAPTTLIVRDGVIRAQCIVVP